MLRDAPRRASRQLRQGGAAAERERAAERVIGLAAAHAALAHALARGRAAARATGPSDEATEGTEQQESIENSCGGRENGGKCGLRGCFDVWVWVTISVQHSPAAAAASLVFSASQSDACDDPPILVRHEGSLLRMRWFSETMLST